MSLENNKRVARRYFEEIINQDSEPAKDELLAPDLIFRNPPVVLHSLDDYKALMVALRKGFPDVQFSVEDEVAEGDKVVTRWVMQGTHLGEFQGNLPSGKQMRVTGMNLFRFSGGQIQEIWVNMDLLGQARQLGWVPGSEESSE